jgi:hypothetical protein
MHWKKMAITDMPFPKHVVIKFPVKEGISAGVIYKHFKDGNTDVANQPCCG